MRLARNASIVVLLAVSLSGLTLAQRPRPEGNRPTQSPPQMQATPPALDRTPSGQVPQVTPGGQIEITPGAPMQLTPGQITPATDWSSTITLPENMPASSAELQALLDSYNVPYDVTFEAMPPSSDLAYTAIVGFGQEYLGLTIAPVYAAQFSTETSGTNVRPPRPNAPTTTEMPAELEQIAAQFPDEIQAMLANASGDAYAGLLTNGVAIVYTGECTAVQCSLSVENLQLQITEESLGAYALYIPGTVSDANGALALIKAAYPELNPVPLAPVAVETGYAFSAVSGDMQTASVIAYYAGTVAAGEYTLVYAATGVGSGYAELVISER